VPPGQGSGLQGRRTGGVKARRFIHHGQGVLPGNRPGLQRRQCQRQLLGHGVGGGQERTCCPGIEGQEGADFRGDGHFLRLYRRIRRYGLGGVRIRHGSPGLQPSEPGLHHPRPGKNVQAPISQSGERISVRERLRTTLIHLGIEHSKSGIDVLKCLSHRRFPHKPIIARGYDIPRSRP